MTGCASERLPTGRWPALIRATVLPLCDGCALAAAALLTVPRWQAAGYGAVVFLLLYVSGRHRLRICLRVSDEISRLVTCTALPLLLPFWTQSVGELARLGVASAGLLIATRAGAYAALRAARRTGKLAEPALIVGTGTLGGEVADLLLQHPDLGLLPVGFVDSRQAAGEPVLPRLGELHEISDVVSRHGVRRVIVCLPGDLDADLVPILRAHRPLGAEVYVVPRMHELAPAVPPGHLDEVWGIPLVPLRRCGLGWHSRVAKRAFDIIVGTVLLALLAPLLLVLMAAVWVRYGRPVLFWQARVTGSGRVSQIAKLRTVTCQDPARQWTVRPDQCTALGRWLRATHLDELPQLVSVIHGDMSLVGPRPERPYFASRFAKVVPRYDDRHRAQGGMTGWAQVHGLNGDTSISERVRFDNYYIEHWSLWLDLVILARTIAKPLAGARKAGRE